MVGTEQAEPLTQGITPTGGEVLVKGRYRILREAALPDYDSSTAKAYRAEDIRNADRPLVAYICDPGLPLRWQVLEHLRQNDLRGVPKLVEEGVVEWSPDRGEQPALLYERSGRRLWRSLTEPGPPMTEKEVTSIVIVPAVEVLRQLDVSGLTHRGIRPDNLFFADDKTEKRAVLGGFAVEPPAYAQPILFETIESGLAHPAGRGRGEIADDLYALGVTVLSLLLGSLPTNEVSGETILQRKIQEGSYAFLVGKRALSLRAMELLKGLLMDARERRWTLDRVERWLDEYHDPNLPNVADHAPHVFTFRQEPHVTGRSLAYAFTQHPQDAARAIRETRFESWVVRSIVNPEMARYLMEEVVASRSSTISAEQLVARVAILLDPKAPIRYRNFSATIDGLGTMLAVGFADDEIRHNFTEVIRLNLAQLWVTAQGPIVANRKLLQRLYRLQHFIGRRGLGFGLERCLYELVPGARCLSTLVLPRYCTRVSELLSTLEAATGQLQRMVEPMDSHITAFIATHFPGKVDTFLASLVSPRGSAERVFGVLGLLASLQDRYGPAKVPGLAGWMLRMLPPVISSYHNQATRKQLEESVEHIAVRGSLVELYNLVGNPARRRADHRAYAMARGEFMRMVAETAKIEQQLQGLSLSALVMGRLLAARFSMLIALIAFGILLSQRI